MAAITLDIGGNTRQLDRDIQRTVNKVYSINLKTKGEQPLGRITGKVNEFTKSLDASNARVIAFGASAGIIFGLQRAFSALVSSTIEVQKSLQDINVILNVSAKELQKFGGELFVIAKNTGQSFDEVAKAATEFSRQGLGVQETLKRTNEALILSRLSGLDAAKSVEALTAAVNSFASQAVTATEVVNKFATVDAAFAVSSADLAEAISRVGSSAAQSGVSLNELIAIVTSAQQTTARGGAVIGNSFKTIFTRLQREKVVDLLESLGVGTTDSSGRLKSTIQLLQDLAKVYDELGSTQQASVAEKVGGVFQINILKAALADLGKEYSIYNSALNVANSATDAATKRNEELNKTYAAQLNALKQNASQLASSAGDRLLGPSFDRVIGNANKFLGGINESDGQGVGSILGKGILDGIGKFISGPGLILLGGVLMKLFRDLSKFATGSVQQLLGLNTSATQQRDLQQSINQILSKNPQLLEMALKGEQGLNTAANSLLASLQKQTLELEKQSMVASQISKAFFGAGVRMSGGVPSTAGTKKGKAAGYIPNFSDEVSEARRYNAPSGTKAIAGIGTIGGKPYVGNNKEIHIPKFGGTQDTAVIPTYGGGVEKAIGMIANGESGSILGRANGFIPNFVKDILSPRDTPKLGIRGLAGKNSKFNLERYVKTPPLDFDVESANVPKILAGRIFESKIRGENYVNLVENFPGVDIPAGKPYGPAEAKLSIGAALRDPNIKSKSGGQLVVPKTSRIDSRDGARLSDIGDKTLFGSALLGPDPTVVSSISDPYENDLKSYMYRTVAGYTNSLLGPLGKTLTEADMAKTQTGAVNSVLGALFETSINKSLNYGAATRSRGGDFDVRGGKNIDKVKKIFGMKTNIADFKINASPSNVQSFYDKIAKEMGAGAFTPNEKSAEAKRIAQKQVQSRYPQWFQKSGAIKETLGYQQKSKVESILNRRRDNILNSRFSNVGEAAKGFIPNFANIGAIQELVGRGATPGERGAAQAALDRIQKRSMVPMGFPLKGRGKVSAVAKALGFSFGRSMNIDALKIGDWSFLQRSFAKHGLTENDFRSLSAFAKTPKGERALKTGFDSNRYAAGGFIPNFAPDNMVGGRNKFQLNWLKEYVKKKGLPPEALGDPTIMSRLGRIFAKKYPNQQSMFGFSGGYIPNFSGALNDAIKRESDANVPRSSIYVAQHDSLVSKSNPSGMGVFNAIDEPTKSSRDSAVKRRGYAAGYIPNFASEDLDTQAAPIGSAITAVVSQLGFLAFTLKGSGAEYRQALEELTGVDRVAAQEKLAAAKKEMEASKQELTAAQANLDKSRKNKKNVGAAKRDLKAAEDLVRESNQNVSTAQSEVNTSRGTKGQKLKAMSGTYGMALSMAAPILGETLKNSMGRETKGARQSGAIAGAAGEIGSMVGMGAMFGPVGAAAGLVAGALMAIPGVVSEFTTDFPELKAEADKSTQELNKFNDTASRLQTASEALSSAMKNASASSEEVTRAQNNYASVLSDFSLEDQKRINIATQGGYGEQEVNKIREEKARVTENKSNTANVGKIAGDLNSANFWGGLASNMLKGDSWMTKFNPASMVTSRLNSGIKSLSGVDLVDQLTQTVGVQSGSEESQVLKNGFIGSVLQGKSGSEAASVLTKTTKSEEFRKLGFLQSGDTKGLKEVLENILPKTADSAKFIAKTLEIAGKNASTFENVTSGLASSLMGATERSIAAVKAAEARAKAEAELTEAMRKANKENSALAESLRSSIALSSKWQSFGDNAGDTMRNSSRDLALEDAKNETGVLASVLGGEDNIPVRNRRGREGLTSINNQFQSATESNYSELKSTMRGLISGLLDDANTKNIETLNSTGTRAGVNAKEVSEISSNQRNAAKEQASKISTVLENLEPYMESVKSGGMSGDGLFKQLTVDLLSVGISIKEGTSEAQKIKEAVATYGQNQISEQIKAYQQRRELALDTKNSILKGLVDSSLKIFGGFEGFLGRPEEKESYLQKIQPNLDVVKTIRSSNDFRYNNRDAVEARKRRAPELGRATANVYLDLMKRSPGFREYLQTSVDKGVQTTGSTSRGGRAGAGASEGGYGDIVEGNKQDILAQLKLAKDAIKEGKLDPLMQKDLQGFVDSIEKAPGGINAVASLQTAQGLGVANQKQYKDIYNKYENAAIGQLDPAMASALSESLILSNDPILNEAKAQSMFQAQMVNYLDPIQKGIIEIAKGGSGESLTAYVPKTIKEMQEEEAKKIEDKKKNSSAPVATAPASKLYSGANAMYTPKPEKTVAPSANNIPTQKAPATIAPPNVQFSQKESALVSNTSAIGILTSEIKSLKESIASVIGISKRVAGSTDDVKSVAGGNGATTTATAPVSVVVHAPNTGDIAGAVGIAIQAAVPEIVNKVQLAMGVKVPPSTPQTNKRVPIIHQKK